MQFAVFGMSSLFFRPLIKHLETVDFPNYERLGRACELLEIKSRPDINSEAVGVIYEDTIVPWLGERAAVGMNYNFKQQRWLEIPEGFVNASRVQPVKNLPNQPLVELPKLVNGQGMWAEVTVPYAEASLVNGPSSNSWVSELIDKGLPVRVYYNQVYYVDDIKVDAKGQVYYRVNPNYYGGVDMLWVPAEALRPITPDEISPLNPDIADKHIVIDVLRQCLSCYEGNTEVFFCRVSTGGKFDSYGNLVDKWATPVGNHRVSRKFITLQMAGGGATGVSYDLPGIGWTSIFATGGVAIHATVWHNGFGDTLSHGCVNCLPEDAKWIFRWVNPVVAYDPGMVDVTLTGESSTTVEVIER